MGWGTQPAGRASLDRGTGWARREASLLALVPSVIVPDEVNVLINPVHADAAGVLAVKVRKWLYDLGLAPALKPVRGCG